MHDCNFQVIINNESNFELLISTKFGGYFFATYFKDSFYERFESYDLDDFLNDDYYYYCHPCY